MKSVTRFIGRKEELTVLAQLRQKTTASLVCVLGRRRIGKSALIAEFGKKFKSFVEVQGLSPTEFTKNEDQVSFFINKISEKFKEFPPQINNWENAFSYLAQKTSKGAHLILLDEISWMGGRDPLFASKLKVAWDTQFKKNNELILVLCGSVSSWIEENLLKNSSFEGRFSLEIRLNELSINEITDFWSSHQVQLSRKEQLLVLSIMGGVPRYLEEINANEPIESQLIKLCFQPTGFLFNEYDKIFTEIFGRKSKAYEKIIRLCLENHFSLSELAKKLKMDANSELSRLVHYLELGGYLSRDYYYHIGGERGKLSHLRVKDNYLRFYLKQIEGLRDKINNKTIKIKSVKDLKNYNSILGYQFENLVLANREALLIKMNIPNNSVVSCSPYYQKKTTKNKGACQIDLLIETNLNVIYVCEFKCRNAIEKSVVKEMQTKIKLIKIPKGYALKPVLIYEGELYPPDQEFIESYFYKTLCFLKD